MSEGKRYSLIRPTLQTPFHIDFDWWQHNDRDWHVYLRTLLCSQHQEIYANMQDGQIIDWVDAETAEVTPVDGLQYVLINHCARQPDFVTEHTALVEGVFRVFLTNENVPMSAAELAARLNRPAEIILRTLTGPRVYRGLRPCCE
jgi:hypothetical protein